MAGVGSRSRGLAAERQKIPIIRDLREQAWYGKRKFENPDHFSPEEPERVPEHLEGNFENPFDYVSKVLGSSFSELGNKYTNRTLGDDKTLEDYLSDQEIWNGDKELTDRFAALSSALEDRKAGKGPYINNRRYEDLPGASEDIDSALECMEDAYKRFGGRRS